MLESLHKRTAQPFLSLPRYAKRIIALAFDAALCVLTVWLAYYLRYDEFISLAGQPMWVVVTSLSLALPIFIVSGFYRAIFRYSGLPAMITMMKATIIYWVLFSSISIGLLDVSRTVSLVQPLLLLFAVGGSRALVRYWLGGMYQSQLRIAALPKALIYGAGSSGRQLASAMTNSMDLRVTGFLDDDDRLHGHVLNGLPVYSPDDIPGLIESQGVTDVLLAMPSIQRKRRNEILDRMLGYHVAVRTLPSIGDLAQGRVTTSDLHELDIDDLLGREPVVPNHILLHKNVTNKIVMVTGAGGSIGSELCRQIVKLGPRRVLLVEMSEYALYTIHAQLGDVATDENEVELVPLLASVSNRQRMREILSTWKPHTVYHAAAYKHVPLVEHNPAEGVRNNVIGTLVTAQEAQEQGVSDFVLISTDKAVRPTNIMGASKRLAEIALQALASESDRTRFSMVRFGNVLGSSGSVVPRFRQQIRDGGPVTVTHPEINRYFMTIPEAAQLVIQAGAMARGGDVFVLDMGQPVKIMDLARRMIELSGLTVRDGVQSEGDIEIEITGLRPGEKLYEELLIGDNPEATTHPRIMKAHDEFISWPALEEKINTLCIALDVNDINVIRAMLEQLVSGYRPDARIVDWVYLQQEAELGSDG